MLMFAEYRFLYLLILIPLILVGYGIFRYFRGRRVKALGDEALVKELMPSASRAKGWIRISFFCLGLMFLIIGLARPQTGARLAEKKTKGAEILVALDVSNSMLAQDYSPNRLERAKLAIARLTDKLQQDRIGLVIFAGTSFVQLPVTTDYISAKMFLGSIDTGSIPVQGTAIGDAIHLCIKSFSAQSEKSRVIVVISDGENHEDDPVAAAKEAADLGIKVYTIGVGSAEGQPIPTADGGAYIHAGTEEFGLNPIIDDIRRMEDEEFGSVVFEEYDEQYMYFLGLALLCFVIQMVTGSRKPRRKLFEV